MNQLRWLQNNDEWSFQLPTCHYYKFIFVVTILLTIIFHSKLCELQDQLLKLILGYYILKPRLWLILR